MELPKELEDFLWEMSGAGDKEKAEGEDSSDEAFYTAEEDSDSEFVNTDKENTLMAELERGISKDYDVVESVRETLEEKSAEALNCEVDALKRKEMVTGEEKFKSLELGGHGVSRDQDFGTSGKKRHRKKKKDTGLPVPVFNADLENGIQSMGSKLISWAVVEDSQRIEEPPKDASDNCLTIPSSSGRENELDFDTRLQLKYFAMSKEEIAKEIVSEAKERCARDPDMSEYDIQHQVRLTANLIERATLGDYTLGDTFDDIEFWKPGGPGYSEAGVFQRPSLAVFEPLLRLKKDDAPAEAMPEQPGTSASGLTPIGGEDDEDSAEEPDDDQDKYVKIRVCKGRFTRRVLKSSIHASKLHGYQMEHYAGNGDYSWNGLGQDKVAESESSTVEDEINVDTGVNVSCDAYTRSQREMVDDEISRMLIEPSIHPYYRNHPCRKDLDEAELLRFIRDLPHVG